MYVLKVLRSLGSITKDRRTTRLPRMVIMSTKPRSSPKRILTWNEKRGFELPSSGVDVLSMGCVIIVGVDVEFMILEMRSVILI